MNKITDREYRTQLKDLVEKAKKMHQTKEYKTPEYGELCMAVVKLIENSDFGKQNAESELSLRVNESWNDKIMDDSFDGTAMQLMSMSNKYLGRFGEVSVEPYSQGLATRSAKVIFVPRK